MSAVRYQGGLAVSMFQIKNVLQLEVHTLSVQNSPRNQETTTFSFDSVYITIRLQAAHLSGHYLDISLLISACLKMTLLAALYVGI